MGAARTRPAKAVDEPSSRWRRVKSWTGVENADADKLIVESSAPDAAHGPAWLPLVLLLGLYFLAVLVYIVLGSRQPLPQVAPDEYQYSALARSVADGHGLTYNGGSIGIRWPLYIYAITPAWLLTDSLTHAYSVAKAISTFMVCAVAFPTWLLARRYMPPLVALVPAVLILLGSWMTSAGQLIMENLALPLATAALAALVAALARPGSRWIWISLAFAVVATGARAQLAILFPVVAIALAVDVSVQGRAWRERLIAHRWGVAVVAVLCVAGGIIVVAKPSVLGAYADLRSASDLGRGLPLAGRQAIALIAMAAVLPLILALAISLRRRAWDERQLRPLLVVFWASTVTFIVGTGILTTGFQNVNWSIQRYVEYSLPLLYVLVVAGIWRNLIATRLALFATGVVAAVLLATPAIQNIQEQRGTFGLVRRGDQLLGTTPGITMAILALVLGGGTALVVRLVRNRSARATLLAVTVSFTGLVFAVQDQAGWDWQIHQARVWRTHFPKNISWIDAATELPLARLVIFSNPYRTPQTEFFNRRIVRTYVPATPVTGATVNGFTCTWSAKPNGTLSFDSRCGPSPTAFYLNDDYGKVTFYNQRVIAQERDLGRITKVDVESPERPRLKAVVTPPCSAPIATQNPKNGEINPKRPYCGGGTEGTVYLDAPSTVVLRFRGAVDEQLVQVKTTWTTDGRVVTVPAHRDKTVTLHVPAGSQRWSVAFDRPGAPPAVPALTSAVLKQGATSTELLY